LARNATTARSKGRYAGPRRNPESLREIPNVGPATVGDLARLGIRTPAQLRGKNAIRLYERLCRIDGVRHDPCVIDVFMAASDFVGGAPARPWWKYTARRKAMTAQLAAR
jgi:hypothetical protein